MEWQKQTDQYLLDNLHNAAGRLYAEQHGRGCGCGTCRERSLDRFDDAVNLAIDLGSFDVSHEAWVLAELQAGGLEYSDDRGERHLRITSTTTMEDGMSGLGLA